MPPHMARGASITVTSSVAGLCADTVTNAFQAAVEADQTPIINRNAAPVFDDAIPIGRHATPAEIARAVLYLASNLSAFVTGTAHSVYGGMAIQPP